MEMIAVDCQPLSLVENIGFRRLMNYAAPKYEIPGRFLITNNIMPTMADKLKVCFLIFYKNFAQFLGKNKRRFVKS